MGPYAGGGEQARTPKSPTASLLERLQADPTLRARVRGVRAKSTAGVAGPRPRSREGLQWGAFGRFKECLMYVREC